MMRDAPIWREEGARRPYFGGLPTPRPSNLPTTCHFVPFSHTSHRSWTRDVLSPPNWNGTVPCGPRRGPAQRVARGAGVSLVAQGYRPRQENFDTKQKLRPEFRGGAFVEKKKPTCSASADRGSR